MLQPAHALRFMPLASRAADFPPTESRRDRMFAKTDELFRRRRVVALAATKLDREGLGVWLADARAIQHAIYDIDLYYERSAVIDIRHESPMWDAVTDCLRRSDAAANPIAWEALGDLRRYAGVERRIHAFDRIDAGEFVSILPRKCADVRIARATIWAYATQPVHVSELRFWDLYDQCWELIEDLDDVAEDGRDWNFNFWLYSFMAGQSWNEGVDASAELLRTMLGRLEEACQRLCDRERRQWGCCVMNTLRAGRRSIRRGRQVARLAGSGQVQRFVDQPERRDLSDGARRR